MNKQQITDKLTKHHQSFTDYFSGLSEIDFLFSKDEKWTAGQQFDHIVRSVSPVRAAMSIPKFVPRLIYGTADRPSRSYEELVEDYQGKLASGGKASGRYLPDKVWFSQRDGLINRLTVAVEGLNKKIEKHSEEDLDKYLLPHPILGNLTIRELLYFTIYHVQHHHLSVKKNLDNR